MPGTTDPGADLDNLNAIQLPRERMYVDRSRRSLSVETRQANLIEYIASFNDIPKKYEIKFDLTGFTTAPEERGDNQEL